MDSIGIGTLAKRAGVGIDTVRYYERAGLLSPRTRLSSGYRRYSELELTRLRFIRRAQALGFSLKEVSDLLALSARRDVARVKQSAQTKLADVERRIVELEKVRDGLTTLIAPAPVTAAQQTAPFSRRWVTRRPRNTRLHERTIPSAGLTRHLLLGLTFPRSDETPPRRPSGQRGNPE